jgi:peptidyl-prolyl cis-trans isomerase D
MTILTKIRNRSGLLVGIIALALLVFVLEQAFQSKNSFFAGDRNKMAEIAGKDVSVQEYESKLEQAIDNEKNRSGKTSLDESTIEQMRNQTWSQIVFERIMTPHYEDLGIAVSTDELFDMVQGKDPHPSVKQAFTDQKTGEFNPAQVVNFLKKMDDDKTGATRDRWIKFEAAIKQERIVNKYTNLIKQGLYITKNEAKRDHLAKNRTAAFSYLVKRYSDIQDSTIKVTDADMQKYYNENKNKYKQENSTRSIDFITYDVVPSREDNMATEEQLKKLADEFKTVTDDTTYVNGNSDTKFVEKYYKKGETPAMLDTVIFKSTTPVGTVIGPYAEGNVYKLAKVLKVKMSSDSVRARHILLKIEGTDTAKFMARADSIKNAIKKGKKFEDLAKLYSKDPGSAAKGGDLGWFAEGMMVPSFNDACFNGKKGDMPIVKSQFGIHIIEITDKKPETPKVQLAVIERNALPSTATFQSYYQKASEFAGKNTSPEAFDKAVIDMGLNKRIAENIKDIDRNINGLENSREVVRWAYNEETKKGSVSKVFELGNKYVVAVLKEVKDKGILPLDAVKPQVEAEAKKEKKAEQYLAAFNAAITGTTSIDQLAPKMNVKVENVESQNFSSSSIQGLGRDPQVVGTLFSLKPNAVSKPVKGDLGVYVLKLNKISEPPAEKNYDEARKQLASGVKNRVDYEMFEALKANTDIVDNRAKFQ